MNGNNHMYIYTHAIDCTCIDIYCTSTGKSKMMFGDLARNLWFSQALPFLNGITFRQESRQLRKECKRNCWQEHEKDVQRPRLPYLVVDGKAGAQVPWDQFLPWGFGLTLSYKKTALHAKLKDKQSRLNRTSWSDVKPRDVNIFPMIADFSQFPTLKRQERYM